MNNLAQNLHISAPLLANKPVFNRIRHPYNMYLLKRRWFLRLFHVAVFLNDLIVNEADCYGSMTSYLFIVLFTFQVLE